MEYTRGIGFNSGADMGKDPKMDKMSITESLVALLTEQDDVDSTNAVELLRNAQKNVVEMFGVADSGRFNFLNKQRSLDELDDIIITASRNGGIDLFRE